MAETNAVPSAPKKRLRWLRMLAGAAGVLVVLVIVLYVVATSSGFFTELILPRVGEAMNATITLGDASIHPFKEVVLKDLKVQTTGTEPLVTAAEVGLNRGWRPGAAGHPGQFVPREALIPQLRCLPDSARRSLGGGA